MGMPKYLHLVLVFLCSPVVAEVTNGSCLLQQQRHKQTSVSGSNFSSPSVVIVGICDSGTRGVEEAVINLGFKACQWALHEGSRDNILTRQLNDYINPVLTASNGSISDLQKDAPEFADAMDTEIAGAAKSLSCILEQESENPQAQLTWGYKNPDHIFLLPVVDAAFDYQPKFLIVARDPRDSCTAHNQGQYDKYKQHFFNEGEQQDCWQFWARVWDRVLNTYEHSQRVAVVRIEDLVMPNPDADPTSLMKLEQVMSFMGIDPTEENMIAELKGMHAYNETYMGHHYNMTEEDRHHLLGEISSRHDNTLLFKSMRRLGYSTSGFELTVPECQTVL